MEKEDWRNGPMGCRCLTGAEIEADAKIKQERRKRKYIFVEQHDNGDWWFHPRNGYYTTEQAAEDSFSKSFWWDNKRPHKVLKVECHFPNGYYGDWNSWYSRDCVTFTQDIMEYKHSII